MCRTLPKTQIKTYLKNDDGLRPAPAPAGPAG